MALRYSTALVNSVASSNSWHETLSNGRLFIYSGTQPASADADVSGDLLVTFTDNGATYSAPTQTVGLFTLSGTASGSIDTLTIGGVDAATGIDLMSGAETHTGVHSATVEAIADNINAKINLFGITALASGDTVLIKAPIMFGDILNTLNFFASATTTTVTINAGTSSVLGGTGASATGTAAVNGLNFTKASSGVFSKTTTSPWTGIATASGTASWFRYVAGGHSKDGTSTTAIRFDGNIATSGGDLTLSNLGITLDATQTISAFSITVPKS